MKHLRNINESIDKSIKGMVIQDITQLVENLNYLKEFIENKIDNDNLEFFSKINTIHTDIKLLSGKINYRK